MKIDSDRTPSSIFGGFAAEGYWQEIKNWTGDLLLPVVKGVERLHEFAKKKIPGYAFFTKWFKDDPVGATAGALLGVVGLVVGGKVIAGVIGGVKGVTALVGSTKWGKIALKAFGVIGAGAIIAQTAQLLVRGSSFLWNFNWNIKDSQLVAQQKGIIDNLFGQFGELAGSFVGTVLCGTAPIEITKRLKIVKFNPALMAQLKEISEVNISANGVKGTMKNFVDEPPELYDELMENIKSMFTTLKNQGGRYIFLEAFKNVRKWVRSAAKFPVLAKIFPGLSERLQNWGTEESQPWSFAQYFEEKIDNISNERLRAFTEEFYESFLDTCSESVMIIGGAAGAA